MDLRKELTVNGWGWVPGVYFAEGLPFAVATCVSMVMFASLGMSNSAMAFWTGIIGLPWSVKFLWAPFLDVYGTKRAWMLTAQLVIALCFAVLALVFRAGASDGWLIACFVLTAFCSATHDIAADGYYMVALDSHAQAVCSGLRNIFYKCAMLAGQGGLVMFAGFLQRSGAAERSAWMWVMSSVSAAMLFLFFYHLFVTPAAERAAVVPEPGRGGKRFAESFRSFFLRDGAWAAVLFLFFYRFAEAQLGKMAVPFMLADRTSGGLGLTLEQQGTICGVAGVCCFLLGGFLAGVAVSRIGFGRCLWMMAAALNAPDLLYLWLSWVQPGIAVSGACIALEQFGYGLGYMAHVLFMVQFANRSGEYKTSHFAFMTGLTILGMTLVGMVSGMIQELFARLGGDCGTAAGYRWFFLWICLCTVPSFLTVRLVKPYIDAQFGKKGV